MTRKRIQMTPEIEAAREEQGEVVGGGYVVLARSRSTARLKIPTMPFEWGTREAAIAEAERLASSFPSKGFCVFQLTDGIVAASESIEPPPERRLIQRLPHEY